jgi:hypothetical protein
MDHRSLFIIAEKYIGIEFGESLRFKGANQIGGHAA